MSVLVGLSARSIQDYVFASNRLVDVIGASALVEELFDQAGLEMDFGVLSTQVLATGGGVSVIKVVDEEQARAGVQRFALRRLTSAPGLEVAVAIRGVAEGSLAADLDRLLKDLGDRANDPPGDAAMGAPAGVAGCRTTGGPATGMDRRFRVPLSKIALAARSRGIAETEWEGATLPPEFGAMRWRFPTELDELGRTHDERSLIGVVHVDGSGIGSLASEWLAAARGRPDREVEAEYRAWSLGLRECVDHAWQAVVDATVHSLELSDAGGARLVGAFEELDFDLASSGDRRNMVALPVRRVVSSGDDLTFITDGRIALALAAEAAMAYGTELAGLGRVEASAGVALVHSHSPFMRAYDLADGLCARAKQGRRGEGDEGPHLDWRLGLLEPGQRLGDVSNGPTMRPYPLSGSSSALGWSEFDRVVLGSTGGGLRSRRWKQVESKAHRLAELALRGPDAVAGALEEWRSVDPRLALPDPIARGSGFVGGKTPLVDAVELLERHQVPRALAASEHGASLEAVGVGV